MSGALFSLGLDRLSLREARVGDRLPYLRHLDDITLITRDGLLVQVLKIEGFPFETAEDAELNYRKQLRDTLLRSVASSRLAVYHHVVRRAVRPVIGGEPEDAFSRELSEAWRVSLEQRRLFVNDLYLTLVRRPLQGKAGWLERLVRPPAGPSQSDLQQELRQLNAARESFVVALAPYGSQALGVERDRGARFSQPCAFLNSLIGGELTPVATPQGDVGHLLGDRRLTFGLDAVEVTGAGGPHYAAIISIKDYPQRSAPGLLDGVLRLPHALTLSESFGFVDRQVALGRMGLALRRLRAADDDAYSLRQDLAQARDDLGAGRTAYGEHHLTILVRSDTLAGLDAAAADVQSSLAEAGAIAVREDINLEPSFWAQFPGNFAYIARKALVSSANFASFASMHNFSSGVAEGVHWGTPITVLETTAHTPYYFNFHNGDLGNFTVIGPSGSGKTVLLTFLLSQSRKLKPRIAYFDKDRGGEIFIRAIGGSYDALRPGEPSGLNPLQLDDTPANRSFLANWLALLVTPSGETLAGEDRALVVDAIDANFGQPRSHRRLRYLRELFQGARRPTVGDLAARLGAWCGEGEHAWLFDNEDDRLDLSVDTIGFDMTRVLDVAVTRTPAMMYLFHRIEQRLDGQPTIIIVDEGWKALDDEVFVHQLKDWQKTIRKRNGIVGFCTQSASDALESRIAAAIVEQAATQIFLPNPKAKAADYIEGFGLSSHEFDLVRLLPDTSRCFLVKQAGQSAVARLDLTGIGARLAVLAGNERSVRRLDRLRAEFGDGAQAWLEPFLAGGGGLR